MNCENENKIECSHSIFLNHEQKFNHVLDIGVSRKHSFYIEARFGSFYTINDRGKERDREKRTITTIFPIISSHD
jgi:hypothetical protein